MEKKIIKQIADKRPKLRFKQADGTEYPDWKFKTLGKITTFFSGGTPKSTEKKYYNGDIPFIGSGDILYNHVDKYITDLGLQESSAKLINKGDLLYALYGATSGTVGIAKISGAINQAVLCIRTETVNIYFLYSFLNYKKDEIIRMYLQGGQGNLSAKIMKSIQIALPHKDEQAKIAKFLSIIDKRIELLQAKYDNLQKYKTGILQKIFTQQIRFKKPDGTNYSDWETVRLGSICEIFRGGSPRPISSFLTKGTGINWLKIGDVPVNGKYVNFTAQKIINDGISKSRIVNKGDFILSNSMSFGRPYIMNIQACIHDGWLALSSYEDYFVKEFLYYSIISDYVYTQFLSMASGSGVKNLNKELVAETLIKTPSLAEQKKIAEFLSAIDEKITKTKTQITATKSFKQGLLQRIFI